MTFTYVTDIHRAKPYIDMYLIVMKNKYRIGTSIQFLNDVPIFYNYY